jgi:hypothetical protein
LNGQPWREGDPDEAWIPPEIRDEILRTARLERAALEVGAKTAEAIVAAEELQEAETVRGRPPSLVPMTADGKRLCEMLRALVVEMGGVKEEAAQPLAKQILVQLALLCWQDGRIRPQDKVLAVLRACAAAGASKRLTQTKGIERTEFDGVATDTLLGANEPVGKPA